MNVSNSFFTISFWPLILFVFWGCKGSETFDVQGPWNMHVIDNTSQGSDGTRVKDVNGDGLPDLVCGWEEGGVVRVYINPGTASDWPYLEFPAPNVEDALLVDLDADGSMDIVSFSEGKHKRITFHWAPAIEDYLEVEKWISEDVPVSVGHSQWMFGEAMNIDNQYGEDLLVGSKGEGAVLAWLQAPQNPREVVEWQLHEIAPAGWIMSIESVDIDHNGQSDVLISDRKGNSNGLKWFRHPGFGSERLYKRWEEHVIGMQGLEPMFLSIEDLDKNQQWEIWIPNKEDHIHHYTQLDMEGNQWDLEYIPFSPQSSMRGKSAAAGDLDGDGTTDIVSTYESSHGKSGVVGARVENGQWNHFDISGPIGIKYDFALLIDMDRDGDLDVLCSEERETSISPGGLGVIWYENPR